MYRQVTETVLVPRVVTSSISKDFIATPNTYRKQAWPATIALAFLAIGMLTLVTIAVTYERLDESDIHQLYGSPPREALTFLEWPDMHDRDQPNSEVFSGSEFTHWTEGAEENARVEQLAREVIPNYNKIWWARNLLWAHPLMRGQYVNMFGAAALFSMPKEPKKWDIRSWNTTCGWDSDKDGFTNGEELGDPCCLWQGTQKIEDGLNRVGWSWELSHPGQPRSVPSPVAKRLIESTDCSTVRRLGYYPPMDKEFDSFYHAVHPQDPNSSSNVFPTVCVCVYLAVLCWWVSVTEIWSEGSQQGTAGSLSLTARLVAFSLAYLHNDLSSAFWHSFFDNCYFQHPLVGAQCRGTQFHHSQPRSQSLAPTISIIGNPIATLLPSAVLLVYGFLGSGVRYPHCLNTGYRFPRWFEWFLTSCCLTSPFSYYFHEAAHTPDADRHPIYTWLQQAGIALRPEFHKVHHRTPNNTWSVMAGWMDFVPNFLDSLVSFGNARVALCCAFVVIVLPWYGWLFHFERRCSHTEAASNKKI